MTVRRVAVWLALAALVAGDAYVRLAPDDPAIWHLGSKRHALALEEPSVLISCATELRKMETSGDAAAGCVLPDPPDQVLSRLDAIAMAAPRTTRLAGSAEEGMITWVQRSLLFGFPDYITAEADAVADGTRLDVFSRQRYGRGDWGVNAARLRDWLSRL